MTKPRLTRQEYNWLRAGRKKARLDALAAKREQDARDIAMKALSGLSIKRTRSNAIRTALARGFVVIVDGQVVPEAAP